MVSDRDRRQRARATSAANRFRGSANPLGTNPGESSQVFSVDTLGRDLRQLTSFRDHGRRPAGCSAFCSSACFVDVLVWDPKTDAVVLGSSCDPFGRNPWGFQIFSMRPDGTGLRQLTDTRGMIVEADGTVTVEMPGPFAYSAQFP